LCSWLCSRPWFRLSNYGLWLFSIASHQLLHQFGACFCRVNVSVGSIFTQVFLVASHGVSSISLLRIHDNADLQFEALGHLKAVHALHCNFGVTMTPELDNRMTFILSSHLIFRQIDCINEAEWLEELTDFQISKTTKRIYKPTHIYTVVLLAPRMVVLRRKRVHFLRHAILIIVTVFLKLGGCGLSIFFSLRSLHHKCLSIQLLAAHGHGHQHRLRRIKLYIGNPNTQKGKFKQGGLI